jgi:hypothetical protein
MGKRRRGPKQTSMWVATQDLPRTVAHPFYTRLNQILNDADFDGYVESACERFYADEIGRPGLPPGRCVETLIEAAEQIERVLPEGEGIQEVVADKGYHSNQALVDLEAVGVRSYISEPDRGRRNWKDHPEAREAVYRNRRRIRGARGKRLLRKRGERLERPFAHLYETGRMRRVYLRGHANILKRVLLQAAAFNLGILMRTFCGVGTPRSLQGRTAALLAGLWCLISLPDGLWDAVWSRDRLSPSPSGLSAYRASIER